MNNTRGVTDTGVCASCGRHLASWQSDLLDTGVSNTWRHIRVARTHVCATARVSATLSAPTVARRSPGVCNGVRGGGSPPPAALTLAEGSYFDADDARQMGLLLPEHERVHVRRVHGLG